MTLEALIVQASLGAGSVVLAELVRDVYHLMSHQYEPLKKLHNWHHRIYRPDLTVINQETYRRANFYNDVPESLVIMAVVALVAWGTGWAGLWLGVLYGGGFLFAALLRFQGYWQHSDLTHAPGPLTKLPGLWRVNRTYHWRHHFDDVNAYYAGHFTIFDKLLGTSLSLKGKTVAITGASGTMGRALLARLQRQGAKPVALTTSSGAEFDPAVRVIQWQPGAEHQLRSQLKKIDILVINHGVNVYGDRTPGAIVQSLDVNALSAHRLMEVFLTTVETSAERATKEVWVNTSEAEVSPAFSPLYETSKRLLGDLVTLRRLDAPCVVRKIVLGPFKSQLNPVGVMSATWVAKMVVALAQRDFRNIIVTINPITYVAFPLKEISQTLYFRLFSRRAKAPRPSATPAPPESHPGQDTSTPDGGYR